MVLSIEKVLNGKYSPAARPYSQLELNDIRAKNLRRLAVGNKMACHDCGHIYFAKENGKKEEKIKNGDSDIGQCSVCWKLKKTPAHLRERAQELVDEYLYHFSEKPGKWTHYLVHVEQQYYKWLYLNFPECQTNDKRPRVSWQDGERRPRNNRNKREAQVTFDNDNNLEMLNESFPALPTHA